MFKILAALLKEQANLTDDELELVQAFTITKRLRKKQYLLQEGNICDYNYFVVKGCLRSYRVGEDGVEHMLGFGVENWWMGDLVSNHIGIPSKNNIDAIEDSELLLIRKVDFNKLVDKISNFRIFNDQLNASNVDANLTRIMSYISDTSEERYKDFVKSFPKIYNRVPLYMIASYLGLSRETLTRIRA
ncbi:MAG: Crp/Fnr family transcriptional regulator [Mucilaginibacter sp.]